MFLVVVLLGAAGACGSEKEESSASAPAPLPCDEIISEVQEGLEEMESDLDLSDLDSYNDLRNEGSEELNLSDCGSKFYRELDAAPCDFLSSATPAPGDPAAPSVLKGFRRAVC